MPLCKIFPHFYCCPCPVVGISRCSADQDLCLHWQCWGQHGHQPVTNCPQFIIQLITSRDLRRSRSHYSEDVTDTGVMTDGDGCTGDIRWWNKDVTTQMKGNQLARRTGAQSHVLTVMEHRHLTFALQISRSTWKYFIKIPWTGAAQTIIVKAYAQEIAWIP